MLVMEEPVYQVVSTVDREVYVESVWDTAVERASAGTSWVVYQPTVFIDQVTRMHSGVGASWRHVDIGDERPDGPAYVRLFAQSTR